MTSHHSAAHWRDRLGSIAGEVGVAGAALGIWADGDELAVAHGVLNEATGVEVTPDSVFQIGSITKVYTGTMVMQLVDEGRLGLDDTVADVLPGVRLGVDDVSRAVTVRHLLTHTSGIDGDVFTDTGRGDDCVARYVDLLADVPYTHPVGAAYSYCNSAFVVLGRMIEVLDGRGWDASLRSRLVEPLGLTHTVTLPEEAILLRAAVGHRDHPREHEPVAVWGLPRSVGPVGLVTADVHDVLAFARLHLDAGLAPNGDLLVSSDAVAQMQQPQHAIPSLDDRDDAIGLAWRLNRWGGRRIIGHDGATVGQLAYLRVDPQARLAVCLLTNAAVSDELFERLLAEIFESSVGVRPPAEPQPSEPAGGSDAELEAFVGRYERSSRRYDLSLRDGVLHLVSTSTGVLADLDDEGPRDYDLHATGDSGRSFVLRAHDREPWSWLVFDAFADGTTYVYMGGRATPRIG